MSRCWCWVQGISHGPSGLQSGWEEGVCEESGCSRPELPQPSSQLSPTASCHPGLPPPRADEGKGRSQGELLGSGGLLDARKPRNKGLFLGPTHLHAGTVLISSGIWAPARPLPSSRACPPPLGDAFPFVSLSLGWGGPGGCFWIHPKRIA